jgi:transcriptional regulator with XRE-family HTH domain
MIDITQCRMARAALGWEIADLCEVSGLDLKAVHRFESGQRVLPGQLRAMQEAFESKGIEFISEGEATGAVRRQLDRPLPAAAVQVPQG